MRTHWMWVFAYWSFLAFTYLSLFCWFLFCDLCISANELIALHEFSNNDKIIVLQYATFFIISRILLETMMFVAANKERPYALSVASRNSIKWLGMYNIFGIMSTNQIWECAAITLAVGLVPRSVHNACSLWECINCASLHFIEEIPDVLLLSMAARLSRCCYTILMLQLRIHYKAHTQNSDRYLWVSLDLCSLPFTYGPHYILVFWSQEDEHTACHT